MSDRSETSSAIRARENGALLLAVGGLAAAFGAASCCALPVVLGSIGLGSAWLGGVALLAAPRQSWLVVAAAALLLGGGVLLWRSRTAVCPPSAACGRPRLRRFTTIGLTLTAVLALLGYAFA